MGLSNAIQYSTKRVNRVTWTRDDTTHTPIDLTNATLYGIIDRAGVQTAITGTLALVTAASGIFDWTYSAADVAQAGDFYVQFYAKYSGGPELSYRTLWHVLPSFDFAFASPSVSPSASASASPSASE